MSPQQRMRMSPCKCRNLNVVSGDMARDYVASHLDHTRIDGMAPAVYRCGGTDIEWVEEREPTGYNDDAIVLRRVR